MVMKAAYKWIPVIDQEWCSGCVRCVKACDHGCLEMVWSFATLTRPADCGSEGTCVAVCPQDAIHMEWVPVYGDSTRGECRGDPPESSTDQPTWSAWNLIRRAFS